MRSDDVPQAVAPTGPVRTIVPAFSGAVGRARDGRSIIGVAAVLTILGWILASVGGASALFFDDLQELIAAGGGALALGVASRGLDGSRRRFAFALAMSLGGAWLGMLAWDVSHWVGSWLTVAGDVVFVASAGLGAVATVGAIFTGVHRDRLIGVAIDTLILLLAGIAVVAALWESAVVSPGDSTASIGAVILIAASAGCAFGLIARQVGLSTSGPWVALAGATTVATSWLLWIGGVATPSSVDIPDFMFSAGVLLIAQGGVTWDLRPATGVAFERIAAVVTSLLPVGAILASLGLLAITHGRGFADLLGVVTSIVIVASAVRQLHLYSRETRAREAVAARTSELQSAVAELKLEIAERELLEAEREQMLERMLDSQRLESIGRLAGGVAHDFNNLLTAIRGYADLAALRVPADDEVQADLDAVRHASDQAASLTRQLLAFSRKQELRPAVVNLGEIITRVEPLLRRLLGEKIALVVQPAPDLWSVRVDPSQLESVIVNLAVNASDAMESGGRLTIETANVELDREYARLHAEVTPGQYAMLAVSDTGVGMDSATLARIFEPFFTTKEFGKGTGLGLATVYGTVRQSGGHVWVYSEPGHGTTFKIYLPRSDAELSARPVAVVPTAPRKGRETILVAEDEDVVRDMIVATLQRHGYSVLAVRSGEEALEAIDRHPDEIGVLLTDVVMPGIGGLELIEQARRRRPDLRAICTSGYTPLKLSSPALPDDVRFLEKPFTLARLDEVIREVLGD